MLSENESEAVSATLCCYDQGAKTFSSSFHQRVFFFQFVDRKVMGLVPKYYLLAGDTNQVSIFFLT